MSKKEKPSAPEDERTSHPVSLKSSFKGVVLVCADCEKRSSGPRKLDSKHVARALKDGLRPAKGQLRVATTRCLGPCPKKAMTCALAAGGQVDMWALRRLTELQEVARTALARANPACAKMTHADASTASSVSDRPGAPS